MSARKRESGLKGRKFEIEILTRTEVEALIRACSSRAPTGIRNRALIGLLYRSGCRIGAALKLKPRDLDREAGTVNLRVGRTARARSWDWTPPALLS